MRLLNGYILVRVDTPEEKTKSGFLIADMAKRLPNSGVVENVARGITDVQVGDHVQFLRYASIDGIDPDTRLCTLEHIIGVFNEKES